MALDLSESLTPPKARSEIALEYRKLTRAPWLWLAGIVALLLGAELFFHIAERMVGRYLVWQNPGRQKIGRSWQEDQGRLVADTSLEKISRMRREQLSVVQSVATFEEFVSYTSSNPTTSLTPDQFALIYQNLPALFRALVIAPNEMLNLRKEHALVHVAVHRYSDRLELRLVTADHQTVHQATLSNEQIAMLMNHGKERFAEVSSLERVGYEVLPAAEFYEVLDRLFYDERANLMRELPVLTDLSANVVQVAFAKRQVSGFVETVFGLHEARALVYYLPEEWITDFRAKARTHEDQSYF